MKKWLSGKKTHIFAILIGLQGVIEVITGDVTLAQFLKSPELTQVLAAFGLSSLRAGVNKSGTGSGS